MDDADFESGTRLIEIRSMTEFARTIWDELAWALTAVAR